MAPPQWKLSKRLGVAVIRGDYDQAEKRLREGGDPNQTVGVGGAPFPLIVLVMRIMPGLLAEFITHGALVNVSGPDGLSPLHLAMDAQDVERLLDAGADPTARSAGGETALHGALSIEAAQLLVDAGADPRALCLRGQLPWQSVDQAAQEMRRRGAARAAATEAAAGWLRALVEGTSLEADTTPVAMSDAESAARARDGRF